MITTHVLDTSLGKPGRGIAIELERRQLDHWVPVGRGRTDDDGRLKTLTPAGPVDAGTYRLRFDVAAYAAHVGQPCFFPVVEIQFAVVDGTQHFHVPLLLTPYGYSTYRGS